MNTQDILRLADDVLELDGKATKGPWHDKPSIHGKKYRVVQLGSEENYGTLELLPEDAKLIAHTRTSAVALARAVRAMVPYVHHKENCHLQLCGPLVFDGEPCPVGEGCTCGLGAALAYLGKDEHGQ